MATEIRGAAEQAKYVDEGVIRESNRAERQLQQMLKTPSWQVVSISQNARPRHGGSYVAMTRNKRANTALNVYQPHQRDEMHCHPGSEHIFMVWQGELTIRGINEGEEIVLRSGELVHINAGHYYQLANETDGVTVLYQVATVPVKPTPVSRRSFRRAGEKTLNEMNARAVPTSAHQANE